MKYLVSLFFVTVMLSCQAQKESFSEEALNHKLIAPDGTDIDFQQIIAKHRGRPTVIEVWASWCGDCVKAMPLLKDTQSRFKNVNYVFLSVDRSVEKWKEGVEKHQLEGYHYFVKDGMKGEFGKAIDLDWIPRYIILDKDGKVVKYRAIEKDFNLINETLESLTR